MCIWYKIDTCILNSNSDNSIDIHHLFHVTRLQGFIVANKLWLCAGNGERWSGRSSFAKLELYGSDLHSFFLWRQKAAAAVLYSDAVGWYSYRSDIIYEAVASLKLVCPSCLYKRAVHSDIFLCIPVGFYFNVKCEIPYSSMQFWSIIRKHQIPNCMALCMQLQLLWSYQHYFGWITSHSARGCQYK